MSALLQLPLQKRRRKVLALPLFPAEVCPFPLTHYAGEIDKLARRLRSLPSAQARNEAMLEYADRQWQRLSDLGATEQQLEPMIVQFADAVWAKVRRSEQGGAA